MKIIRVCAAFPLLIGLLSGTASTDPASVVRSKFNVIQSGKVRPGSVYTFTASELTAYVQSELPTIAPEGVRQPHLELGTGTASATAVVDFLKIRHGQGESTPWLIGKLIEGEKVLKVNARIVSANGRATVYLQRVEISGLAVSGSTLDFLIRTFFLPLYPGSKINEPFELHDRVDHIEVAPQQARVVIRK